MTDTAQWMYCTRHGYQPPNGKGECPVCEVWAGHKGDKCG